MYFYCNDKKLITKKLIRSEFVDNLEIVVAYLGYVDEKLNAGNMFCNLETSGVLHVVSSVCMSITFYIGYHC